MIQKIDWHGLSAIEFEAGGYQATLVPEVGANLIRLYNTEKGVDILHTPAADEVQTFLNRPQIFGMPLLFPPNRIEDGTYTFNGKTYQYPITIPAQNNYHHGNIKSLPFTVTKTEQGDGFVLVEASYFSNSFNNSIYQYFPHEFECRMSFRLSSSGLEHTVTFINMSDDAMPLGVGYHTPIMVPFTTDGNPDDYRLRLSVGKIWELSERGLPTGNLLELSPATSLLRSPKGMKPTGAPMEWAMTDESIEVDGKPYHGAIMTDTASGIAVFYETDAEINHWTFWNNGGNVNWACPEPQTWAINAPNLKMDPSITGMQSVAPHTSWKSVSKLYVK